MKNRSSSMQHEGFNGFFQPVCIAKQKIPRSKNFRCKNILLFVLCTFDNLLILIENSKYFNEDEL